MSGRIEGFQELWLNSVSSWLCWKSAIITSPKVWKILTFYMTFWLSTSKFSVNRSKNSIQLKFISAKKFQHKVFIGQALFSCKMFWTCNGSVVFRRGQTDAGFQVSSEICTSPNEQQGLAIQRELDRLERVKSLTGALCGTKVPRLWFVLTSL